ncbi:ribosomal protein L1 [Acrasis kona]|uniref:Ribosomal protein L1 n=1 Tax=Acrasis kona TaxID=1008807 RepID=A0AAW2Z344_9EUKA
MLQPYNHDGSWIKQPWIPIEQDQQLSICQRQAHQQQAYFGQFTIREETMEELLEEGIRREKSEKIRNVVSRFSVVDSDMQHRVAKKRHCTLKKDKRALHHTQVYKVRFEEPSLYEREPLSTFNLPEDIRFINNEYQAFETGSHPTQVKEQDKAAKIRFHKLYW